MKFKYADLANQNQEARSYRFNLPEDSFPGATVYHGKGIGKSTKNKTRIPHDRGESKSPARVMLTCWAMALLPCAGQTQIVLNTVIKGE
jgi:hypothetical protein